MDDDTTRDRCAWAGSDPLSREYHDGEWGVGNRHGERPHRGLFPLTGTGGRSVTAVGILTGLFGFFR